MSHREGRTWRPGHYAVLGLLGLAGVVLLVDHDTAGAWAHVAKVGDRFAALQAVYDAVIDRFGGLAADLARGISLRHDWGPQYRSGHFLGSIAWLGITDDAAFLGEPETPDLQSPEATAASTLSSRASRIRP